MNITDIVLPVHWYRIPCVHIWMLWPNLCKVRNHHFHCFFLPRPVYHNLVKCLMQTLLVLLLVITIITFILTVIIIIFIEIRIDIIYDGVLSNSETIFFPFKDTAKMGPMIALATRSTQNSWQRYQTLLQSWWPWLWWLIMTFMSRWAFHCGLVWVVKRNLTPDIFNQNMTLRGGEWFILWSMPKSSTLSSSSSPPSSTTSPSSPPQKGSQVPLVRWRRRRSRHLHWRWRGTSLLRQEGFHCLLLKAVYHLIFWECSITSFWENCFLSKREREQPVSTLRFRWLEAILCLRRTKSQPATLVSG